MRGWEAVEAFVVGLAGSPFSGWAGAAAWMISATALVLLGCSARMTLLILLVGWVVTGVRVSPWAEVEGLDFHLHGEALEV